MDTIYSNKAIKITAYSQNISTKSAIDASIKERGIMQSKEIIEALNIMGINPETFDNLNPIEQLEEIAKKWNRLSDDNSKPNNKQQIVELKQKIKHSKNFMEIRQLQKEIGELSKKGRK